MLNIVKHRYWYFAISLLVIVPGMVALGLWGLPLSIDFTSGTQLELQFDTATGPINLDTVRAAYATLDMEVSAQTAGDKAVLMRSKPLDVNQQATIIAKLEEAYGPAIILNADTVGPAVGAEVARSAALAVGAAALGILSYITFAFRKLGGAQAFRYGVCAVIAMLHDALVVIGMGALFGKIFGWEVDALFLTALLTVVGFSVHDTIVVFDRIRENMLVHRRLDFEEVVNHSIVQTMDRSINTQLTVMFTLVALALFGGVTIRHFIVILLVGVFSGTYSSIFNAAPLLVVWEKQEWKNWFGRKEKAAAA
jgi:preprotein translocase subunit SecF